MKTTLIILGLLTSLSLHAKSIEISSFVRVSDNLKNEAAELCGVIKGEPGHHDKIVITSDPDRNPGKYVTLPSQTGHFCQVIRTRSGRAEVQIWSPEHKKPQATVQVKIN